MAKEPPEVKDGTAGLPVKPGLGVELDDAGVKAWQAPGDSADWM
jgi:L-alanine-DL-glutamate epimerase-like enolase superfamily enzyme